MPVVNIAIDQLVFAQHPNQPHFRNLTGLVFGRLTVLGYAGRWERKSKWYAQCICGNIIKAYATDLTSSRSLSCGCLRKEATARRSTKHGHSKGIKNSPELASYKNMLNRCNNINGERYIDYGNRGIRVLLTFEEFLDEVGPRPSKEHTIDRIDNNGNYERGNIRWATRLEQGRNKRNNILIEYNDDTKTLAEWAEVLGIKWGALWLRLYRSKMCIHHAFTLPHGSRKPKDCPVCNL